MLRGFNHQDIFAGPVNAQVAKDIGREALTSSTADNNIDGSTFNYRIFDAIGCRKAIKKTPS